MSFQHAMFVTALVMAAHVADAAETYRNPVIDENLADPSVIRRNGTRDLVSMYPALARHWRNCRSWPRSTIAW